MKSLIYSSYNEEQLLKLINPTNYFNNGYPTSNCLVKGSTNEVFFKELNVDKIKQIFHGDYLLLFDEYYNIIKKLVKTNEILGIIYHEGNIYEFSRVLDKNKFLDEGNAFEWKKILELFDKILFEINNCVRYNYNRSEKIGFETAIWNFTINGILFDLDPPKILKITEDTSFTRKEDINHVKRTIYRSFDEIGMKTNLLVTLIIGEKHNSFRIKNSPNNYIEILIDRIIKSFTSENVCKKFITSLSDGISKNEVFIDHPIEILRREIMAKEKGNDKIFVFFAGTSESGKSCGINYIKNNYSEVQHIKIRDVFPKVYEDTFSNLSFEEWQNFEETRDLNNFWKLFVNKVYEMVDDDKNIIILDTMYGVEGMIELYNILGDKVNLLYIDAPFNERVIREYNRLRTDSISGTRKADLNITLEDVIERTIKKDKKKNKKGADQLPKLSYSIDWKTIKIDDSGEKFPFIIDNNGTIEEFYSILDSYIMQKLVQSKSLVKELKKWS